MHSEEMFFSVTNSQNVPYLSTTAHLIRVYQNRFKINAAVWWLTVLGINFS